jgi:hypothetical protein
MQHIVVVIPHINGLFHKMILLFPQLIALTDSATPDITTKIATYYATHHIMFDRDVDINYNNLIRFYYGIICIVNSKYCATKLNNFIAYFKPHIVASCSNGKSLTRKNSKKINNSCRRKTQTT